MFFVGNRNDESSVGYEPDALEIEARGPSAYAVGELFVAGAGVDFDFRYTIYATAFINEAPADPGKYTAVPDA